MAVPTVMAALVAANSKIGALYPPKRDRRDKPGDDEWAALVLPLTNFRWLNRR